MELLVNYPIKIFVCSFFLFGIISCSTISILDDIENEVGFPIIVIITIIVVLVIAGSTIFYFMKKNPEKKIKSDKKERHSEKPDDLEIKLGYLRTITNDKIEILEKRITILEETIQNIKSDKTEDNKEKKIEYTFKEREIDKKVIKYHPVPSKSGEFLVSKASTDRIPNESVYEIIFKDLDGRRIEYKIIDNEVVVQRAIKAPEVYVESVCDIENAHNPEARQIKTLENGTARMENDKWKIEKRARVRYMI